MVEAQIIVFRNDENMSVDVLFAPYNRQKRRNKVFRINDKNLKSIKNSFPFWFPVEQCKNSTVKKLYIEKF